MFAAIKTLALATALAHLHGTSAAPAPAPVAPEVIPGPGLPSLESLGLTSSYLYSLPRPVSDHTDTTHLLARADPRCGDEYNYGPVDGAVACFHYLQNLGQTGCGVPSGQRSVIMCSSNGIRITGYGIGQASWCEHVALGVLWTIDHCTRPQGDTAGWAVAYGNGEFWIQTGR